MKTKHTPGPWLLWGKGDPSQVVAAAEGGFVAQTLGGNDAANAALIAAAPDMLAALQDLDACYCEVHEEMSREQRAHHRQVLIKARTAVARATGCEA